MIKRLEHATALLVMAIGILGALDSVLHSSTSLPTKVGTTVMPLIFSLLNMAPGRVSCLIHQTATLSISTMIIGAPVSHVRSTRWLYSVTDVVDVRSRQRVVIRVSYCGLLQSDGD